MEEAEAEAKANEVRDRKEYKKLEKEIVFFNRFAWALVIVGIISFAVICGKLLFGNPGWAQTLGDFTGGVVASFWSLAGIMFVYIAFLGQKQQLMLQEEELRLTRDEMISTRMEIEGQKREMEEQNKTAALQRFENTYFSLLGGLSTSIENILLVIGPTNKFKGHQAYNQLNRWFKQNYNRSKAQGRRLEEFDLLSEAYEVLKSDTEGKNEGTDPFLVFDEIALIFSFVNRGDLNDEQRQFYSELLLSKLKKSQVTLLTYYTILYHPKSTRSSILRNIDYYYHHDGLKNYIIHDTHYELCKESM